MAQKTNPEIVIGLNALVPKFDELRGSDAQIQAIGKQIGLAAQRIDQLLSESRNRIRSGKDIREHITRLASAMDDVSTLAAQLSVEFATYSQIAAPLARDLKTTLV